MQTLKLFLLTRSIFVFYYLVFFRSFLRTKYNVKRFGLEGGEAAIVGLRELVKVSAESGVNTIVMGMPHRGRLNVLANVVKKPLEYVHHSVLCYIAFNTTV